MCPDLISAKKHRFFFPTLLNKCGCGLNSLFSDQDYLLRVYPLVLLGFSSFSAILLML